MSLKNKFTLSFLALSLSCALASCSPNGAFNIVDEKGEKGIDGEVVKIEILNPSAIQFTGKVSNNTDVDVTESVSSCQVEMSDLSETYFGSAYVIVYGKGGSTGLFAGFDYPLLAGQSMESTEIVEISNEGAEFITEVSFECGG